MTVVPVGGNGFVKVYPFITAEPNASLVNFKQGTNVANAATIKTCFLCGPDITVKVSKSAHVIIDVLGYYHEVNDQGTRYFQSGSLNGSSKTVGSIFSSLGNFLTFNRQKAGSRIEVQLHSRARAGIFSGGATGVRFQVRVDGGIADWDNDAAITSSNAIDFISIFAVFDGLSAGNHTVSVWARANSNGGTSSGVLLDPGGWGGRIVVKETY